MRILERRILIQNRRVVVTHIIVVVFLLFGRALLSEEEHFFRGKHFVASYLGCDLSTLSDLDALLQAMNAAVHASGAKILNQMSYIFLPNGLTVVYLLSESHASLHTYPEYGACFVDLFTCGDNCSSEKFDKALRDYLKPEQVTARLFLRDEDVADIPLR